MHDNILDKIYKTISHEVRRNLDNVGLYEGQTGQILYLSYYAFYKRDDKITKEVQCILDEYLSNFVDCKVNPTYSAGMAGVLVGIKHLNEKKFIDVDYEEIQYELKSYILLSLDLMLNSNKLDFLYGAIGIGVFSIHNNFCVEEINSKILTYLNSTKIISGDCYSWNMLIKKDLEYEENIGLAHGMSSIVLYLCRLSSVRKNDYLITDLISNACRFILSNRNVNANVGSIFPTINKKISSNNLHSRMAWCYGDLGIAFALWNAGKLLKDNNLMNFSLYIFDRCTKRKDPDDTLIHDSGFCHGTSGVSQIFRRMYYETGRESYLQTADYWIGETVKLYTGTPSCFLFYNKNGIYKESYDLLSGIVGAGMALLAADNNISTSDWDKLFLLSEF